MFLYDILSVSILGTLESRIGLNKRGGWIKLGFLISPIRLTNYVTKDALRARKQAHTFKEFKESYSFSIKSTNYGVSRQRKCDIFYSGFWLRLSYILILFLIFRSSEPRYSYKLYSYKKKTVYLISITSPNYRRT